LINFSPTEGHLRVTYIMLRRKREGSVPPELGARVLKFETGQ